MFFTRSNLDDTWGFVLFGLFDVFAVTLIWAVFIVVDLL